jgi:hypothetical protein
MIRLFVEILKNPSKEDNSIEPALLIKCLSDNTKINFTLRKKDISSSRRKEQIKGIDFVVESRNKKREKQTTKIRK